MMTKIYKEISFIIGQAGADLVTFHKVIKTSVIKVCEQVVKNPDIIFFEPHLHQEKKAQQKQYFHSVWASYRGHQQ